MSGAPLSVPDNCVCVCADELLEDIAAGRCSVGENVRKVAGQWLEVAACIPPSFFQVRVSRVTLVTRDTSSAANRLIGGVVQSQRRPLLGTSPS